MVKLTKDSILELQKDIMCGYHSLVEVMASCSEKSEEDIGAILTVFNLAQGLILEGNNLN